RTVLKADWQPGDSGAATGIDRAHTAGGQWQYQPEYDPAIVEQVIYHAASGAARALRVISPRRVQSCANGPKRHTFALMAREEQVWFAGSHATLCWRKPDSNSWSHRKRKAVPRMLTCWSGT